MSADGGGLAQVTNSPENELPGGWSHDGTRMVVDYSRLTSGGQLAKGDIAVVTVATGATVNLTKSSASEEHPDWQP